MSTLLARRLLEAAIVLLLTTSTALLVHPALPGSPREVYENPRVSPGEQHHLRRAMGLDVSRADRYGDWLGSALRGNLGVSLTHGRSVVGVLATHLPASALLACGAVAAALGLALPLAVLGALFAGSVLDRVLHALGLVCYSLPQFWVGIAAISVMSFRLGLLPPGHLFSPGARDLPLGPLLADLARHLVLPSLVLGVGLAGGLARLLRAGLLDALSRDYIRTAAAAGIPPHRIVLKHALRPALGPTIQVIGLWLPFLASGLVVTEVVFSWPGLGRVTYTAILARDYPLVVAATALTTVLVVLGGLAADALHALADPRLAEGRDP